MLTVSLLDVPNMQMKIYGYKYEIFDHAERFEFFFFF